MLSKALPVPQGTTEDAVVETGNEENEGHHQTADQEIEGATETEPQPAEDEEIAQEPNQTPSNAYVAEASNTVHANEQQQQLLQKPERRAPKQADDRLLTWAALGLTIAIVVLLLKKFMKADGHGAVFLNES